MGEAKGRIIDAVTIMNEDDTAKVWKRIQAAFTLSNAPAAEPDEEELDALKVYHNGDPECQPFVSQEELLNSLIYNMHK